MEPATTHAKRKKKIAGAQLNDPIWLRRALTTLAAMLLFGLFSTEISDTDFWWHLRTGQYMVEAHHLPTPDPFAWTTASAPLAYSTENRTRQFNLTHEWLAQVLYYLVWAVGGAPGIVAVRGLSMTLVCGLTGLVVWRRTGSFYGAILGAFACASTLYPFALDRPYQFTFLFLAATVAALEFRRYWWALPGLFLIWANCHGGYFLGFIVLGVYCAETLWLRKRDRLLWIVSAACVLASAINPNGLLIFSTLLDYRSSNLQSRLLEWARPTLWPPSAFSVLLAMAVLLMLTRARAVRPADWLLLIAFGGIALTALRNTAFAGLIAPVLIAGVWPWRPRIPNAVRLLFPALALAGIALAITTGKSYRLRAAEWKYPTGAADFILEHRLQGRLFNTYEHGGYLIWRLWPRQQVFIDGRALSESLFNDYARILYNHDNNDGQLSGSQLLDRFGVETIVMNTFEPSTGTVYVLAPALADPAQTVWKLVYNDAQSVIFVRTPPPGVGALNSLDVLTHMETECGLYLEHQPKYSLCARSLADVFVKIGNRERARRWLGTYLEHKHGPDPEAEQAYRTLWGVP